MDKLLCFAINNFGTGGHPVADEAGLKFFGRDYVRQCVERAVDSGGLSQDALNLADDYLLGVTDEEVR
jgi:hypothetical protein